MTDSRKPRASFTPWDRRELPGLFTVDETARRIGNYKWIEMRLFEALVNYSDDGTLKYDTAPSSLPALTRNGRGAISAWTSCRSRPVSIITL